MGNNQQTIIWPTTHPNPKLYTIPQQLDKHMATPTNYVFDPM